MKTISLSDPGRVRSHNEDSVLVLSNANSEYILAVADGMGGHKAGEVASGIAIDYLKTQFGMLDTLGNKEEAISWIRNIV